MIQKRKTSAQKLAETAARKKGSPPPNISTPRKAEKSEQAEHTVTAFFKEKIIPAANTTDYWRKKIATKSILDHSLQFDILDRADQLILISSESKMSDPDFKPTFVSMYSDIVELQDRQDWTKACWKIVVIPLYIPPVDQMTVLTSGLFHTSRNVPMFSNWNIVPGLNLDFKLSKDPYTEKVDQPISKNADILLDNAPHIPPHTQPRGDDWFDDLPELNESTVSTVGPIPLNFNSDSDFENSLENSFVATFNAGSFLPIGPSNTSPEARDISCPTESRFLPRINSTRRGALTKGEKMSILEGKNELRPVLKSELKRTNINRGVAKRTRYIPYDFFAKFLIGLVGNQNKNQ